MDNVTGEQIRQAWSPLNHLITDRPNLLGNIWPDRKWLSLAASLALDLTVAA